MHLILTTAKYSKQTLHYTNKANILLLQQTDKNKISLNDNDQPVNILLLEAQQTFAKIPRSLQVGNCREDEVYEDEKWL